ncbi:MAG: LPS-assembly protein LptD [Elusimicrobia bacterium]|nr:LPS-assembly protein LptD [Elusimicrobiota bacterium]
MRFAPYISSGAGLNPRSYGPLRIPSAVLAKALRYKIFLFAFVVLASGILRAEDNLPFEINCDYLKYYKKTEVVFSSGNVFIKRDKMKLYADEAEFRRKESFIFLKGGVRIEDSTTTITCDEAEYCVEADTSAKSAGGAGESKNGDIILKGNVRILNSESEIKCSYAAYNRSSSSGVFKNVRVLQDKMYFAGQDAEQRGDTYIFNKAYLTTCDLEKPHYKMSSPRIVFVNKKSVTMKHAVFSIRGVPLFYTPYYRQRLGERKWSLSFRAGHSTRKGSFIKTRLRYSWSKNFRTYLINDYFSRLGHGKGAELDYKSPSVKSNLYVYGINEKDTGVRNLTFRQSHWQKLPAGFLWQSYLDFQDYSVFNSNYLRDESPVLKPTYVRSRVSLSKSVSAYYLRLSGYRNETWSSSLNRFDADNVIAPELYFRLNPVKHKLFSYDFSYDYKNYFNTDVNAGEIFSDYTRTHSSYARIFNSYRLMRGLTLFPRMGYQFYKRGELEAAKYYFHNINTTLNFYRPLKLSFTHNYKKESGKKSVTDSVSFSDEYRPARGVIFRQSVIYDVKKSSQPLENRFSLLNNQLNVRAAGMNFYVRNYYDIPLGEAVSWEGEIKGRHFSSRFTHNRAEPDFANWFQSFNFKYGKWDAAVKVRAFFNYRKAEIKTNDIIEKQVVLKRNLHCWDMMFKYLVTRDRREGWIFFNITAFPERPLGIYHDAVGGEWSFRKK